jgi:phospholipase C
MPADADARLANIQHIVVVMMENRSFDHMLGYLSHPDAAVRGGSPRRIDVDGLTGEERIPHGGNVTGSPLTPQPDVQMEFRPEPNHNFTGVAQQVGGGAMDGFVPNFRDTLAHADEIEKQGRFDDESRILGFLTPAQTPIHHYMATEFCVLDRWFCSFPGGTYPNRMCQLAGMTTRLTNHDLFPDLGYLEPTTVFQLLRQAHVDWRHYEGDICFLRSFKAHRLDFERIRPLREWLDAGGQPLAPVTFIDPNMTGVPGEDHAADDHPPTAVEWGQAFLRRVLLRLRSSPGWDNTLLVVTYDEHGGFYDHVAPPGTAPFHERNPGVATELTLVHPQAGMFGVRVPAFVVSPRVSRGQVGHRIYDHASIIRTVLQRFAPDRIALMPARVRQARHLGELLGEVRATAAPPPLQQQLSPMRLRTSRIGSGLMLGKLREDPDDARALLRRFGMPVRR